MLDSLEVESQKWGLVIIKTRMVDVLGECFGKGKVAL